MQGMRRVVQIAGTKVWIFERWGLSIPLYIGDDGQLYVPVRVTCQQLGITVNAQLTRIREDRELMAASAEMPEVTEGGLQKIIALRWKEAAWWLAHIDTSKVRREIREDIDAIRDALKEYCAALMAGKAPIPALAAPASEMRVIAVSSRSEIIWVCEHGTRYRVIVINGEAIITPEED